ncbi:MAG TPA: IS4 family transposase [Phycisphaerae bacterium]|jgi:hypothetical protein
MAHGRTLFARFVELLPRRAFESAVARYRGDRRVRSLSCMDQLLAMIYAQLTERASLRETTLCLCALGAQRYHCGIRGAVPRSSLADANETRDFRIFRDTALRLISAARQELPTDPELLALHADAYALDATTIDLCLKLFPWARFRRRKAAVKLHTLLDLHTQMPVFIALSDGKHHEVNTLDTLATQPGAYYIIDKGYIDFGKLYHLHQIGAFFVTRAKRGMIFSVRARQRVAPHGPILFDQLIRLRIYRTRKRYPDTLRRIGYRDPESGRKFIYLTNHQLLPAELVALLYRKRWQIELFFKWIKMHLRIKAFFGRSRNAVATQVWVAVIVFVLVLRFRHRHNLTQTPGEVMSILSAMILEKTPVNEVFCKMAEQINDPHDRNQLSLF